MQVEDYKIKCKNLLLMTQEINKEMDLDLIISKMIK